MGKLSEPKNARAVLALLIGGEMKYNLVHPYGSDAVAETEQHDEPDGLDFIQKDDNAGLEARLEGILGEIGDDPEEESPDLGLQEDYTLAGLDEAVNGSMPDIKDTEYSAAKNIEAIQFNLGVMNMDGKNYDVAVQAFKGYVDIAVDARDISRGILMAYLADGFRQFMEVNGDEREKAEEKLAKVDEISDHFLKEGLFRKEDCKLIREKLAQFYRNNYHNNPGGKQ